MFSIIIPTRGRSHLAQTIDSIVPQLQPTDEIIVVADGEQPSAIAMLANACSQVRFFETPETKNFGHAQRNFGMSKARGDYLAFIDDDDLYLPGAFAIIRRALAENPARPHLFRIDYCGTTIWRDKVVALENLRTSNLIVPNEKDKLGVWRANPSHPQMVGGDFLFIQETLSCWPSASLVWCEEIISKVDETANRMLSYNSVK